MGRYAASSEASSGEELPSERRIARHCRKRAAGLEMAASAAAGTQSLQVSSGSSEFPVRVSTATAEPGGVRTSQEIRPKLAAPPASRTRERYRPSVRGDAESSSTLPGFDAPSRVTPPSDTAAVTCSESARNRRVTSPSRVTRYTRPRSPVPSRRRSSRSIARDSGRSVVDSQIVWAAPLGAMR